LVALFESPASQTMNSKTPMSNAIVTAPTIT
jgi:hypothetical protein